jgi:hypothetical protein
MVLRHDNGGVHGGKQTRPQNHRIWRVARKDNRASRHYRTINLANEEMMDETLMSGAKDSRR